VLQLRRVRRHMRPWIAMAAAYALALLSGVAVRHFMSVGDTWSSDLFVICHGSGNGSPDNQDLRDNRLLPQSPCVLCALTKAPCAIVPIDHSIAAIDVMVVANAVPGKSTSELGMSRLKSMRPRHNTTCFSPGTLLAMASACATLINRMPGAPSARCKGLPSSSGTIAASISPAINASIASV
jgi:hypothetical protein